LARKRYHFGSE